MECTNAIWLTPEIAGVNKSIVLAPAFNAPEGNGKVNCIILFPPVHCAWPAGRPFSTTCNAWSDGVKLQRFKVSEDAPAPAWGVSSMKLWVAPSVRYWLENQGA